MVEPGTPPFGLVSTTTSRFLVELTLVKIGTRFLLDTSLASSPHSFGQGAYVGLR